MKTASADLIVRSCNFADIEALQLIGDELILLCASTLHIVAPAIEAALDVPFLHLADATADAIREKGVDVIVPDQPDRSVVHDEIYEETHRLLDSARSCTGSAMAARQASRKLRRVSNPGAPCRVRALAETRSQSSRLREGSTCAAMQLAGFLHRRG
jgi:hypothetical protein